MSNAMANPMPDSQAKTGSTCPLLLAVCSGTVSGDAGSRPSMPAIVVEVVGVVATVVVAWRWVGAT